MFVVPGSTRTSRKTSAGALSRLNMRPANSGGQMFSADRSL